MSTPGGYKTFQCRTCGYIYAEEAGAPGEALPAGTRRVDVPANWICPMRGTRKSDFDMIEI